MKFRILLLTTLLLNVGCAQELSSTPIKTDKLIIPSVKQYTKEQQKQAADEMEKFCTTVPVICTMVSDYGKMRDAARIALGIHVDTKR